MAATDRPMPPCEHILLAARSECRPWSSCMNKVDAVDDLVCSTWLLEVRELLSKYEFPGDEIRSSAASALKAPTAIRRARSR